MNLFSKNHILILFSLLSFFVIACSDDNEVAVPEESPMEKKIQLLAGTEGKAWILQRATLKGFDVSGFLPACEKDNLYVFYPTGEGEYQAGELKCKENKAEVIESGHWELSEDLETLTLSVGMFSNDSKVLEIREDLLQLEMTYKDQTVIASFEPAE